METPPPRRLGYRNLEVWKQSVALAETVARVLGETSWKNNLGLKDQLQRSSLSIPSNIAEGEEQMTNRATLKHYYIARGSMAEMRTQLILAKAHGLITTVLFDEMDRACENVSRLIAGVIRARRLRENLRC